MKKGMGWPIGVVVILLSTVLTNIGVIVFTGDDPSFAIEPDYYQKAVDWASTEALGTRSDALAWRAEARVIAGADGSSRLSIVLRDATGSVVRNARVSGALLHIARANDVQQVRFAVTDSGTYEAGVTMARTGLWELRLAADRQAEQFRQTLRIDTDRTGP